jgi:putative zinc finger protein
MTARFTPINCEEFAARVADLLERDLDEASRAVVEAHALDCEACGALLSDLRKLSIEAANLPVIAPSRDLWDGIAARIDAPVIPIGARSEGRKVSVYGGRDRRVLRAAAIAASLLFAAGLGGIVTYRLMLSRSGTTPEHSLIASGGPQVAPRNQPAASSIGQTAFSPDAGTKTVAVPAPDGAADSLASSSSANPSVAANVSLVDGNHGAEQTFEVEIARLRAIVQRRRAQLDPVTISVIERNLKVIDDAISQCKAALAKDPASRFLIESLNHALENKVELLRTAAMLPSRS